MKDAAALTRDHICIPKIPAPLHHLHNGPFECVQKKTTKKTNATHNELIPLISTPENEAASGGGGGGGGR